MTFEKIKSYLLIKKKYMKPNLIGTFCIWIRNFFPIHKNRVLFYTFQGTYTCNPKYICEEIRKNHSDIDPKWVVFDDSDKETLPENVEAVRIGTWRYYKTLYTSKVCVDNAFNIPKYPVKKKRGQIYIQTMHGSLGIKRIGKDSNRTARRNKRGDFSAKMTDYIISNSDFEDEVYRTSFWADTEILKYGHPRNDILFSTKENEKERKEIVKKIYSFFGLKEHIRLAMYAPTYSEKSSGEEMVDFEALRKALQIRFGGEWVILNRLHPRDARVKKASINSDYVLDGNKWKDIQELMLACDLAITDYSSWIFDYVLTQKPGIVFAPNLQQYETTTGFYYPLETTPFPIAKTNAELEDAILSFDIETYEKEVNDFIASKGCVDDGYASARVVNKIAYLER